MKTQREPMRLATLALLGGIHILGSAQQAAPPVIRDPADRVFREQSERERERALERSPGAPEVRPVEASPTDSFPEDLPAEGPDFLIRQIKADGDLLLEPRVFARLVAPFAGRRIGSAHIRVLLERLNKALATQGYFTSKAFVSNQNLAEGELIVSFLAGRIERIVFDGQDVRPGRSALPGVRMVMPFRVGDILKLQDIEQAVDQFNRVRGNQVQVQIQPAERVGGSIVDFKNTPTASRQGTISLDNQGSPATGRWRSQATVEQGNALGFMESLSLGLTTSSDTNAVYGTASFPWGYNTLSFMGSWSEYMNLVGDTALVHGTSRNFSVASNHLIQRDQNSKTAVDLSLAQRSSNRTINNALLTPQALTVARIGMNRLSRYADGSQWTIDGGWVQGLAGLGALRDPDNLPSESPRAQFSKVELNASVQRPVSAGPVAGLIWRSRLNAQWSRHALYSSEQIFAGGVSSVRGFAESAAGGDRGIVVRNELIREIGLSLWQTQMRLDPYVFVDAARVHSLADGHGQSLVSVGGGLRLSFAHGLAEMLIGRPVKRPDTLNDAGLRVNINVTYYF